MKTVQQLRSAQLLLSSTESIVLWGKEHHKDLFNPINAHSEEEADPEDFGLGSLITGVEVTGAVKQLCNGSALGVDEIRLELLKALDVVRLSWLTHLCHIALTLGTLLLE